MVTRRRTASTGTAATALPYNLKPGVLITFRPQSMEHAVSRLTDIAGVKDVAYAADFATRAVDMEQTKRAGMLVFNSIGIAVANFDPDQEASIAAIPGDDSAIATVEPEPIFFAFADGASNDLLAYLRGYRDAVNFIYDKAAGTSLPGQALAGIQQEAAFQDNDEATWGLQATKALDSRFSGKGIKVAVLDTGFDLDHPDFRGRQVTSQSFIPGQDVQDDNGHGTHCIGTSCGPRNPVRGRRYGIAYEAEIFAGKVLTNQGSALGRSTLAGIEWAVNANCHIVSMSLGSRVEPGASYLNAFESTAREAMRRGTLIVAAAGNDSRRSQSQIKPVSSPANCPSIMAVAAVDRFMRTADFSNAAINTDASVDIAGPGVEVYSSAPEPAPTPQPPFFRQWTARNDTISGTSMATPHVAGVLALLRQEFPDLTAGEIWRLLTSRTRALPQAAVDVGSGFLQA
jgi:subtilisin family serine protease